MMVNDTSAPSSYSNDTRLPYSGVLHGLSQFILVFSLILPPTILASSTRQWLFLPILLISSHLIFRTTSGDLFMDIGLGPMLATQCAVAFDYLVLCDPRKTFKLKGKEGKGKDHGSPGDSLISRLKWAVFLLLSPRGIGWTHEPPADVLPPRAHPGTTRRQFVLSKILEVFMCLLLEPVAYIINATNPALTNTSTSMWDHAIHYRILAVLGFAAGAYARLNIGHSLLSAFVVGLGISQPEDWPGLFGSIENAWCLGQFWSRTWHHLLRRIIISTSNAVLPVPAVEKSKAIFAFARVAFAFFISGILHTAADYMMTGSMHFGTFAFFMLQPLGILAERVVFSALGVSFSSAKDFRKPNAIVKTFGYMWVLTWFTYTAPAMLDPMMHVGLFAHRKGNGNMGSIVMDWFERAQK